MSDIDVFISYKREERQLAHHVQAALNDAGFVVGTDADIEPSMDFVDAIQEMIDTAKATIVLWTKASVQSEWVKVEARRALKLHRMTPPESIYRGVLVEAVELPMDFETVNMLDFTKTGLNETAVQAIVSDIQQKLSPTAKTGDEARGLSAIFHEELQAFHTADQIDDVAAMQGFVENYPNSILTKLANERIRGHQKIWPRLVRKTLTYGGLGVVCAAAGVAATLSVGSSSSAHPLITPEDLKTLRSDYQTAQDSLATFENTASDFNADRTFLEQRVTDLLSQSRADAARVERLLTDISTLQSEMEEVQRAASSSETTLQDARTALEVETGNLSEATEKVAALEAALETAQSNHTETEEALDERISFLEDGLRLTQAARDRALAEVQDLDLMLGAAVEQRVSLQEEIDGLQSELTALQDQPGLRLASFSEGQQSLISQLNFDEILLLMTRYSRGGGQCFQSSILDSKDQTLLDVEAIKTSGTTCGNGTPQYSISGIGLSLAEALRQELADSLSQ